MINISNLNDEELKILRDATINELSVRKTAKAQAKRDAIAAKAETRAAKKASVAEKNSAKIAALEEKLAALRKAHNPVTKETLRRMGAAV